MLCACTSNAASADFAAVRDVLAKSRDIFVIDICDLLLAEATRLLLKLLIQGSSFCALILWLGNRSKICRSRTMHRRRRWE